MKKYNVFKVIGVVVFLSILLSFLIPQTSFDGYGNISTGNINPVSFIDTFMNSITSIGVFLNAFMLVLFTGILYFVIKKSNKYETFINNVAFTFRKLRIAFAIISVCMFAIITAITGEVYTMIIFVPVFIDIARKLGFNKVPSVMMTVGSVLIGSSASLYTLYSNQILGVTVSTNILFKVVTLVLGIVSIIVYSIIFGKNSKEITLEKPETKTTSISIVFDIILVLIILGMTPWNLYFGTTFFTDIHEAITSFKLLDVPVFGALVGNSINALGTWTVADLNILVMFFSLILSIVFKFNINDYLDAVAEAIKKTISYALIIVLANVVLVNIYNSGIFYTIISLTAKISNRMFGGSILSVLSAVVYPDYTYATQFTLSTLTAVVTNNSSYVIIALIFQMLYSLVLFISPTSILILMAIKYTNVSYKEWIKNVIAYFVSMLVVFVAIIIAASLTLKSVLLVILAIFVIVVIAVVVFVINYVINLSFRKMKLNRPAEKETKIETKEDVKEETKVEEKQEVKKEEPKKQNNSKKKKKKNK